MDESIVIYGANNQSRIPGMKSNFSEARLARRTALEEFFDEVPVFSDSEEEEEYGHQLSLHFSALSSNDDRTNHLTNSVIDQVSSLCCNNCDCCRKIKGALNVSRPSVRFSFSNSDSGMESVHNNITESPSMRNNEVISSEPIKIISEPIKIISSQILKEPDFAKDSDNSNLSNKKTGNTNVLLEVCKNNEAPIQNAEDCNKHEKKIRRKRKHISPQEIRRSSRTKKVNQSVDLETKLGATKERRTNSSIAKDTRSICGSSFKEKMGDPLSSELQKENSKSKVVTKNKQEKKRIKTMPKNAQRHSMPNLVLGDSNDPNVADLDLNSKGKTKNNNLKNTCHQYLDKRLSKMPVDATINRNFTKAFARKLGRRAGIGFRVESPNSAHVGFRSFQSTQKLRKLYSSDEWLTSEQFLKLCS